MSRYNHVSLLSRVTCQVVAVDVTSVELRWMPPLGTAVALFNEVCGACGADNSLLQYAASATVNNASRSHGAWAPLQAVGTCSRRVGITLSLM